MAKLKKKTTPLKHSSKKPAAAKSSVKSAAKHPAAKKVMAKSPGKPAPSDAKRKKLSPAKPVKALEKITKKGAAPAKDKAAKAGAPKKALHGSAAAVPAKTEKKAADKEKELKKTPAEAVSVKPAAAPKKESKTLPKKGPKGAKKEEAGEEDDFVSDEDFGSVDEIGEYEEELKAVEELDEEAIDDEAWAAESKEKGDEEIYLTDAEGRRYCRSRDCDQIGIVDGYCRYHYLLFWKKIQVRKKILADGKLERYVEELTARYPDKFLEMIRRDLRTEKDFLAAIQELEIDESANENEFEEETTAYIEEVRGIEGGSGVEEEEF